MSFKLDVTWVGPTCVCVGGWEREREWVGPTSVCVCVWERERDGWVQLLCVCVSKFCVCVRERERERIYCHLIMLD